MQQMNVVVIPGDGIGPELTRVTLDVLRAVESGSDFSLSLEAHEAGAGLYRDTGRAITEATLEACRQADAVLKGPVGDPSVRAPDGTEAGLLGGILRNGLDAYANIRPIRLYPGVPPVLTTSARIDYVIVRENTEGLYASRGRGFVTADVALDTMVMTRGGVERVVRKAFERARARAGAPADGVQRVTCVDKANVLRSFAFFRRIFQAVAQEYPDIENEWLHSDATATRLVMEPEHFDVIVTENFVGDLLSDLGGGTIGGLGMCPSGNVGGRHAYFEPIHGSAPGIAGRNLANPLGMILASAMMLEWLGRPSAGGQVRQAVESALAEGAIALRPDGTVAQGTTGAAGAVVERLA